MKHVVATNLVLALSLGIAHAANEFHWLNPLPQGHSLRDVEFLTEDGAIAVGEYGTVLASYDGGATWETVITRLNGIDTRLNRIAHLDQFSAVAVGENGRIVKTTDAGATWVELASGTSTDIRDVHFVDSMHGMAVGEDLVLRTSNGGETWQPMTLPYAFDLSGIHVLTPSSAIAVGRDGFLLRTNSAGNEWDYEFLSGHDLNDVAFVDLLHGTIAAGYDTILQTSDGGDNWDSIYVGELHVGTEHLEVAYASASDILLAVYMYGAAPETGPFDQPWGMLRRSSNGGQDWQLVSNTPTVLRGVASSPSGAIRLAVGDGGSIMRSTGGSFGRVAGSPEDYLDDGYAISFVDANTGIVAGSACTCHSNHTVFLRTMDGGQSWSRSQKAGHTSRDVVHASSSVLYSVGARYFNSAGSLLKSSDGGASWAEIWTSNTITSLHSIDFSSPTYGVATGSGGRALVIDNDVVTTYVTGMASVWSVQFAGSSTSVLVAGAQEGAALTPRIARSLDGGQTWASVDYGSTSLVTDITFVSTLVGFAVGKDGLLIKTEDAGASWTPIASGTSTDLGSIAFADPDHGVIVATDGQILRAFDGGATWADAVVAPTPLVGRVAYPVPGQAYLIGQQLTVVGYEFGVVSTSVPSPAGTKLELLPNVPNPFNPSTTIRYVLPSRQRVRVTIYDVSGRPVATLVDREEAAGAYDVRWNGTDANGDRVASGVYLVRIAAGKESLSRKIVLLK